MAHSEINHCSQMSIKDSYHKRYHKKGTTKDPYHKRFPWKVFWNSHCLYDNFVTAFGNCFFFKYRKNWRNTLQGLVSMRIDFIAPHFPKI